MLANVTEAVRFRLSRSAATFLGIPDDVYALKNDPAGRTFWDLDEDEWETATFKLNSAALHDRVQSAGDRITALFEPYPNIATSQHRRLAQSAR